MVTCFLPVALLSECSLYPEQYRVPGSCPTSFSWTWDKQVLAVSRPGLYSQLCPALLWALVSFSSLCLSFLLRPFTLQRVGADSCSVFDPAYPTGGTCCQVAHQRVLVIQINIKKALFCPSVICDLGLCIWHWLTTSPSLWMNFQVPRVWHGCPQLRLRCQGCRPTLWTLLKIP